MRFYDKAIAGFCQLLICLLRLLSAGGTSLPGKLALKLDKNILANLTQGKKIIVITGTNGKTTTARIAANILKHNGKTFYTNKSGANLLSGITTTVIENYRKKTDYILLEIDEAAFSRATSYFRPEAVIVTNFFRDQLDRYGELYSTLNKVKLGISKIPEAVLILNGDDSLCVSIGRESCNPKIYYGFSDNVPLRRGNDELSDSPYCIYCMSEYTYLSRTIGHLGHFRCDNCGYEKPALNVYLHEIHDQKIDSSNVIIAVNDKKYEAKIRLPAVYNIYNALAALSLTLATGLDLRKSIPALSSFEGGFGRMEKIDVGGKYINIMLVKNPTGLNSTLDYLLSLDSGITVCFSINDNIADGKDISWLWDVNFEKLRNIFSRGSSHIICSGKRAYDMALRLKYMDVPSEKIWINENYSEVFEYGLANTCEGSSFYLLPTYTSMLDIRKILQKKYALKEFWK